MALRIELHMVYSKIPRDKNESEELFILSDKLFVMKTNILPHFVKIEDELYF